MVGGVLCKSDKLSIVVIIINKITGPCGSGGRLLLLAWAVDVAAVHATLLLPLLLGSAVLLRKGKGAWRLRLCRSTRSAPACMQGWGRGGRLGPAAAYMQWCVRVVVPAQHQGGWGQG